MIQNATICVPLYALQTLINSGVPMTISSQTATNQIMIEFEGTADNIERLIKSALMYTMLNRKNA
jgi:hypothetical protein